LRVHTDLDGRARRKRILAMMEQVRLPEVERIFASYPHRLSGGQRQRIMLAMALVLEPKLLIADEPTHGARRHHPEADTHIDPRPAKGSTVPRCCSSPMTWGVVAEIAGPCRGDAFTDGWSRPERSTPSCARQHGVHPQPALGGTEPDTAGSTRSVVGPVVLEANELGKVYRERSFFGGVREVAAAQDVTLTLRKGRTLGIVGESGSGKSTVARCIVRLIDPTSEAIRLVGRRNLRLSRRLLQPHRKRNPDHFSGPLSLAQSAHHSRREHRRRSDHYGMSHDDALAKARDLLELVDLPVDAVSRYPHQFSGGQRQRIAIARALALDPDVLVADEAVSALDVSVQAQVLELLDEIQTRLGIALLFITHDLRVAAQICDDVAVMQHGRIVEQGPAAQVLTNPPTGPIHGSCWTPPPGRGWDFANFRPVALAAAATS